MTTRSNGTSLLRIVLSQRMLIALLMGFYSGLPLLLTGSVLQAWMKENGVDLTTIGLFALAGLPYSMKFLWAPLFDRYTLPLFGRRRGWLIVAQIGLALAIAALAFLDPAQSRGKIAAVALLVAFCSASQDVVIDAYRRESLADTEQGLGASLYVNGYRLGMLLASGGGLILADYLTYPTVYLIMAGIASSGILTTLCAPEPPPPSHPPSTLLQAAVQPLLEFLVRRDAIWILVFIVLYKLGDTVASQMTTPFYLELGYSKTEIGAIVKLFGFWATVVGGLLGGTLILQIGLYTSLWYFGILQALSTAAFVILTLTGTSLTALASVVSFENLTAGLGTSAFVTFMADLTDRRFTATQYALISSLMGIPRVIAAAPSGWLAEALGWQNFFVTCAVAALPGMVVLFRFRFWLMHPTPS